MRQRTCTIYFLPDKSGVPAKTMRLEIFSIKVRPVARTLKSPLVKIAIRV
jgi:hypothetical protein